MDNDIQKQVFSTDLTKSLQVCDDILNKRYLEQIKDYPALIDNTEIAEVITERLGVRYISKIVYDSNEDNLDKLNNVFAAMNNANSRLFILLEAKEKQTGVYIGTCDNGESAGQNISVSTLENSLQSNFPGIKVEKVVESESKQPLTGIFNRLNHRETVNSIACVSGIPSLKSEKEIGFVQGLEKIIDGMGNSDYYAIFLADPVSLRQLETVEQDYMNLYSALSVLEQETLSIGQTETNGIAKTVGETLTTTVGLAFTHSNAHTESYSKSHNESDFKSDTAGVQAGVGVVGASYAHTSGHASSDTTTEGNSDTVSDALTKSLNEGVAKSVQVSINYSEALTQTRQRTFKNRKIMELMSIIDEQLKRIRDCKNYGMWNFGIYFLAKDNKITQLGANICTGILSGESSGVERRSISFWDRRTDKESFDAVLSCISRYHHPQFKRSDKNDVDFTQTALVSTKELASGMSLPQKSLPTIPVLEIANFGRAVSSMRNLSNDCFELGHISHLGKEEDHLPVNIDIKSLTAHTFITGSTGSGKSTAIYHILNSLINKGKKFLVIEPAKGEYKDVFGNRDDVNVYGTNPSQTELLRLNPFSFPKGIHVMEHLDRLIDILNAAWPMYAAMPAILKEAVEVAYQKCGWNLLTSENKYTPEVFPDFYDLLRELPEVIEKTGYVGEAKGTYTGALLTRVKSLTNGYFRTIFQKDEISSEDLFDKSCIVDLSRVGSTETKALLMGTVFLKLQEYRMATAKNKNEDLNHVTILEEAHNLLRRTSSEQGMESANLQGKSVEMITNAIAEMRTYGEGFIIVDQSPGLLDKAVIRNTNTKIILRLPDYEDRMLVGKAQNLTDQQINELARLQTGCASVYQNDWQEAVLCQITKDDSINEKKYEFKGSSIKPDPRIDAEVTMLRFLVSSMRGKKNQDINALQKYYPDFAKQYASNGMTPQNALDYFCSYVDIPGKVLKLKNIKSFNDWTVALTHQIFDNDAMSFLANEEKDILLQAVFELLKVQKPQMQELWDNAAVELFKWRLW